MKELKKLLKLPAYMFLISCVFLFSSCTPIDFVEEADLLIDAVELESSLSSNTPSLCKGKEVFYRNGEWIK